MMLCYAVVLLLVERGLVYGDAVALLLMALLPQATRCVRLGHVSPLARPTAQIFGIAAFMVVLDSTANRIGVHQAIAPGAVTSISWALLSTGVLAGLHGLARPARCNISHSACSAIVVGVNPVARHFQSLQQSWRAESIVGFFDDRAASRLELSDLTQLRGRLDDVAAFVRRNSVPAVYITLPTTQSPRIRRLIAQLQDTAASVYVLSGAGLNAGRTQLCSTDDAASLAVAKVPLDRHSAVLKRGFDVGLTIAVMPAVLPLMFAIAILLLSTSGSPVLFRQRRHGLNGKLITVLKFRTMAASEDGESTFTAAAPRDHRVTRIGAFLRSTSLDELPQFFNVLGGSMSLVGPRPHAIAMNERYGALIPGYMLRHCVKPGITGLAQVNGCRGGEDEAQMRQRTAYDLHYVRSSNMVLDLQILGRTVSLWLTGNLQGY
ncbi:exopolysaccharide biosynthesis polyprenyl glycosylphosphotransferase [Ramlibacter sp. AN1015]|uniref:exopolysaccharide biosynthesis polyprenyl glycosylphosphotransferase n=1 Tax=Ramlibacter sp. AN1015 TaxID=3133428 RepID=UPI0030C289E9